MAKKKILLETAERCVKLLKEKYKVKRVILIGSLAYGTIHKKSDIDLVVEGLSYEIYMKCLTELYDILPPGVEINLIPFEDAFESLKQKALQKGKVLYG